MEVLGSVEAEVDRGFVSALAGGVVVDLHLARRLAEKLEVDLVMRVAVEAGARVGEEAGDDAGRGDGLQACLRSEEHTSELQSLMRISYAVFCLKKKNTHKEHK